MPIVEPEVLMDGAHSIERCEEVTNSVLQTVFDQLVRAPHLSRRHGAQAQHGHLGQEGCQPRPAGSRSPKRPCADLKRHVPPAVPGIAFLSGGQSSDGGDAAPVADEQARAASLGAHLQLRPRPAGRCAQGVGRVRPPTSRPDRRRSPSARSSTASPRRAAIPQTWRARPPRRLRRSAASKRARDQHRHRPTPGAPPDDVVVDVRDVHYGVDARAHLFQGLDHQGPPRSHHRHHGAQRHGQDDAAAADHGAVVSPTAGRWSCSARTSTGSSGSDIYALRKRMGMLFQNGALLTDLDVFENVAFPVREHTDLPEPLIRRLVLTKLQAVGLRGAADLMPAELSGGMARRVALARAIVMDPEILHLRRAVRRPRPDLLGSDPAADPADERGARASPASSSRTTCRSSRRIAHDSYLMSGGKVVASRHAAGAGAQRRRKSCSSS